MRQEFDHLLRTAKNVLSGALFSCVCSVAAFCEPQQSAEVSAGQTTSIAVNKIVVMNLPPFAMMDNGAPSGVFPDLFAEADSCAKTTSEVILVPVNRMLKLLEIGAADYTILPQSLMSNSTFSPIAKIGHVGFVVWPRRGLVVKDLGDMQGLIYAARRHGYFARIFDLEPLMEYTPFDHHKQAIQLLQGGRVDAVSGVAGAMLHAFDQHEVSLATLGRPFVYESEEIWLSLAPGNSLASVDAKFIDCLREMEKKGRYQEFRQRYIDDARLSSLAIGR